MTSCAPLGRFVQENPSGWHGQLGIVTKILPVGRCMFREASWPGSSTRSSYMVGAEVVGTEVVGALIYGGHVNLFNYQNHILGMILGVHGFRFK